jgi:hypothetical protein
LEKFVDKKSVNHEPKLEAYRKALEGFNPNDIMCVDTNMFFGMVAYNYMIIISSEVFKECSGPNKFLQTLFLELAHLAAYQNYHDDYFANSVESHLDNKK